MANTPFGTTKAPPFGKDREQDTSETGEPSAPARQVRARQRARSTRSRKPSRR